MQKLLLPTLGILLLALGFWAFQDPSTDHPDSSRKETVVTEAIRSTPSAPIAVEVQRKSVDVVEPQSFSALPGTISGVVVDLSGSPLPGVRCTLSRGRAPSGLGAIAPVSPREAPEVKSLYSDEQGGFRFSVGSGWWGVRVEADGLSPWEETGLQAGDFRWIRLAPPRALRVRVRDEQGVAVAGATVRLVKGQFSAPLAYANHEGLTNGSGIATFASIPYENWFVAVTHSHHFAKTVPLVYPSRTDQVFEVEIRRGLRLVGHVTVTEDELPASSAIVRFEALEGPIASHEVKCDAQGNYVSDIAFMPGLFLEVAAVAKGFGESRRRVDLPFAGFPESREIRVDFNLDSVERIAFGRVVDGAGNPLPGVRILKKPVVAFPEERVIHIPSAEILEAQGQPDFTALMPSESMVARYSFAVTTDAEGFFQVDGLHADRAYKLLVLSPEHSNAVVWCPCGVPGERVDLGTVELLEGGRVWGYVRRGDGNPVEGAVVKSVGLNLIDAKVVPDTDYEIPLPTTVRASLEGITNQEGMFMIVPFPQGDFYLQFAGELHGPYSMEHGGELGPLEFTQTDDEAGGAAERISVVLHVRGPDGGGVEQAYVQLVQVDPDSDSSAPITPAAWTSTFGDAEGRVALSANEAGTYEIIVKDFDGQLLDRTIRLELTGSGLEMTVDMQSDPAPARTLKGWVSTMSGEPLSGVVVSLEPQTGRLSCRCFDLEQVTDEYGTFSFGTFLKGNHRLVINDPEGRFPPTVFYPAIPGEPLTVIVGE
jgi:protocatechuate 3,4-dioxygenase beta subunit